MVQQKKAQKQTGPFCLNFPKKTSKVETPKPTQKTAQFHFDKPQGVIRIKINHCFIRKGYPRLSRCGAEHIVGRPREYLLGF